MKRNYYNLTPAQSVALMQCKFSLFKRVINILFSATLDYDVDYDVLKEAFNILVKRNDCIRDRFTKKGGKLCQYFLSEEEVKIDNISFLSFDTKEEQEAFISQISKKAVKYLKGEVFVPYVIKTYDNKTMILLKVCHLILDMYGVYFIINDLLNIYDALINKKELPDSPSSFEQLIINDLKKMHNEYDHNECKHFFEDYLSTREEPYYAGIAGPNEPNWQKRVSKHKRTINLFFVNNDTKEYKKAIPSHIMNSLVEVAKELNVPFTSILFFACSLCCGLLNNNANPMLPIELLNCRGTIEERNCGGTKAQSLACYTDIDYSKSFIENLREFYSVQLKLNKRYYFPDTEFEMLIHKTFNSSQLGMYYSIAFSFIPYEKKEGIEYNIYSNGKGALPCYLIFMYDINSHDVIMGFDAQTKIINEYDVNNYYGLLLKVLNKVIENPYIEVDKILE